MRISFQLLILSIVSTFSAILLDLAAECLTYSWGVQPHTDWVIPLLGSNLNQRFLTYLPYVMAALVLVTISGLYLYLNRAELRLGIKIDKLLTTERSFFEIIGRIIFSTYLCCLSVESLRTLAVVASLILAHQGAVEFSEQLFSVSRDPQQVRDAASLGCQSGAIINKIAPAKTVQKFSECIERIYGRHSVENRLATDTVSEYFGNKSSISTDTAHEINDSEPLARPLENYCETKFRVLTSAVSILAITLMATVSLLFLRQSQHLLSAIRKNPSLCYVLAVCSIIDVQLLRGNMKQADSLSQQLLCALSKNSSGN